MVPAVIFVLSIVWMQLVKGRTDEECQKEQTKRDINFEQAYQVCSNVLQAHAFKPMPALLQDAVLNEVDSGAELDSQGEEETEDKEKKEEDKKDE